MPQYAYDHVHLISPDPVKTAEFYEKAFGATRVSVTPRPDGRTLVELSLSGSRLLLMNTVAGDSRPPDSPRKRYGLEHFGVRTDNLDETAKNLKAMGVQFVQEITVSRPGLRIAFIMAPDNVLIELMEKK
ncbi:MAG: VOC family protein [Chloroflexi bacterium]|nr:VOC family protein [Chloroflexota bacterium]